MPQKTALAALAVGALLSAASTASADEPSMPICRVVTQTVIVGNGGDSLTRIKICGGADGVWSPVSDAGPEQDVAKGTPEYCASAADVVGMPDGALKCPTALSAYVSGPNGWSARRQTRTFASVDGGCVVARRAILAADNAIRLVATEPYPVCYKIGRWTPAADGLTVAEAAGRFALANSVAADGYAATGVYPGVRARRVLALLTDARMIPLVGGDTLSMSTDYDPTVVNPAGLYAVGGADALDGHVLVKGDAVGE